MNRNHKTTNSKVPALLIVVILALLYIINNFSKYSENIRLDDEIQKYELDEKDSIINVLNEQIDSMKQISIKIEEPKKIIKYTERKIEVYKVDSTKTEDIDTTKSL